MDKTKICLDRLPFPNLVKKIFYLRIDMLAARTVLLSLLLLDIYMGTISITLTDHAQADNDSQIVSDNTLMKRTGDSPHHGTG